LVSLADFLLFPKYEMRAVCGEVILMIVFLGLAFMLLSPIDVAVRQFVFVELGFAYPLTLASIASLTTAITTNVMVCCGMLVIRPAVRDVFYSMKWFCIAIPIGTCHAVYLAASLFASQPEYLGHTMPWAMGTAGPVTVLLVAWMFGRKLPPRSAIWFVCVTVLGCLVITTAHARVLSMGFAAVLLASTSLSFYLVMTDILFRTRDLSVLEGLHLVQVPSSLFLILAACVFEVPKCRESGDYMVIVEHPLIFLAAALLGMAKLYLRLFLLLVSSSHFERVFMVFHHALMACCGIMFFEEGSTWRESLGYTLALGGFVGYTYMCVTPEYAKHIEQAVTQRMPWLGEMPAEMQGEQDRDFHITSSESAEGVHAARFWTTQSGEAGPVMSRVAQTVTTRTAGGGVDVSPSVHHDRSP